MTDAQSLSAEVFALAQAAESVSARVRRDLRGVVTLPRAYRKLFFDDAGALRPEGREVLADLVDKAGIGKAVANPDDLQIYEGMRRIVLHLFGRFRLDEARIRELERQLRQAEDDEA